MSNQKNRGKELSPEATMMIMNAMVKAGNKLEIDEPPLVIPPMVYVLLSKPKPN